MLKPVKKTKSIKSLLKLFEKDKNEINVIQKKVKTANKDINLVEQFFEHFGVHLDFKKLMTEKLIKEENNKKGRTWKRLKLGSDSSEEETEEEA